MGAVLGRSSKARQVYPTFKEEPHSNYLSLNVDEPLAIEWWRRGICAGFAPTLMVAGFFGLQGSLMMHWEYL